MLVLPLGCRASLLSLATPPPSLPRGLVLTGREGPDSPVNNAEARSFLCLSVLDSSGTASTGLTYDIRCGRILNMHIIKSSNIFIAFLH